MPGPEFSLVEKPAIDFLRSLGYVWLPRDEAELQRNGLNQVLLRDHLVAAVQRLNDVDEDSAQRVYHDLLTVSDNARWLEMLRGSYSRSVPGEATHRTLRLLDFERPDQNTFTVTNQFYVESQHSRIADLVVHVNGIPLAVIEAKKPGAGKLQMAYDQIRQYEQQIPRLFHSNAFNIVTDRHALRYGVTGAPWEHWGRWRDPWPRTTADFPAHQEMELGLWALLEPSRLLDLVAHFIVFERQADTGRVTKKMARYQQYRAVQRVYTRAQDADQRRGLVWHTQGSGKSLTMAFSVLKLKLHHTDAAPRLPSPNILVLTDRKDLDRQIAATFHACGLPNPKPMGSVAELRGTIHSGVAGLTVLSTIHKFEGSRQPVPDSGNWIVFVDEAHRTQEKDLGAYLRATFPDAWMFGFTGTPVKKGDLNTFQNFSPPREAYLDRYSIDDAVADGATVPIRYTSRKAEWQVDPAEIDILFDNWFADEPEDVLEALRKRGVTVAELAKHPRRVELIAFDLWEHFKGHAMPDGYNFEGDRPARELRQATIRKATELKRITYEKVQENPLRYETFSERVLEVIRRMEQEQLAAAEALKEFEQIAKDLVDEDKAHESSGLSPRAYGVLKILESLMDGEEGEGAGEGVTGGAGGGTSPTGGTGGTPPTGGTGHEGQGGAGGTGPDRLARLAEEIDEIYGDELRAPVEWHLKEQVRKELRQAVRYRAHQAGFLKVQEVAERVEQYALRHYVRLPAA